MANLDSQQIELIGRSVLEKSLMQEGFEVARPIRDNGIDLVAFLNLPDRAFAAIPIQMKAATGSGFGVSRKYEHIPNLVFAFIWNVLAADPEIILLTCDEVVSFIPKSARETHSWTRTDGKAAWIWTRAPKAVVDGVAKYKDRWEWLRARLLQNDTVR